MSSKNRRRAVRAFWEVATSKGAEPVIMSREKVIANPRYLAQVESELRKRLVEIVDDAESLDLHLTDAAWWDVCRATRANGSTVVAVPKV